MVYSTYRIESTKFSWCYHPFHYLFSVWQNRIPDIIGKLQELIICSEPHTDTNLQAKGASIWPCVHPSAYPRDAQTGSSWAFQLPLKKQWKREGYLDEPTKTRYYFRETTFLWACIDLNNWTKIFLTLTFIKDSLINCSCLKKWKAHSELTEDIGGFVIGVDWFNILFDKAGHRKHLPLTYWGWEQNA